MINTKITAIVLATAALFAGEASAKGCLKGAAVGGVAGHFAKGHSLIGAGVGCAIGRHRANKKDREAAAQQNTTADQKTTTTTRALPQK